MERVAAGVGSGALADRVAQASAGGREQGARDVGLRERDALRRAPGTLDERGGRAHALGAEQSYADAEPRAKVTHDPGAVVGLRAGEEDRVDAGAVDHAGDRGVPAGRRVPGP